MLYLISVVLYYGTLAWSVHYANYNSVFHKEVGLGLKVIGFVPFVNIIGAIIFVLEYLAIRRFMHDPDLKKKYRESMLSDFEKKF